MDSRRSSLQIRAISCGVSVGSQYSIQPTLNTFGSAQASPFDAPGMLRALTGSLFTVGHSRLRNLRCWTVRLAIDPSVSDLDLFEFDEADAKSRRLTDNYVRPFPFLRSAAYSPVAWECSNSTTEGSTLSSTGVASRLRTAGMPSTRIQPSSPTSA